MYIKAAAKAATITNRRTRRTIISSGRCRISTANILQTHCFSVAISSHFTENINYLREIRKDINTTLYYGLRITQIKLLYIVVKSVN